MYKTTIPDLFGNSVRVLCVRVQDGRSIEAPGLPAVKLDPLIALRQLDELSDEDMVNVQRANLLDQSSPNPSIETLLHAFLPHNVVDHTTQHHFWLWLTCRNESDHSRDLLIVLLLFIILCLVCAS